MVCGGRLPVVVARATVLSLREKGRCGKVLLTRGFASELDPTRRRVMADFHYCTLADISSIEDESELNELIEARHCFRAFR